MFPLITHVVVFGEFQELYDKIQNLEKHQDRLRAKGLISETPKQIRWRRGGWRWC